MRNELLKEILATTEKGRSIHFYGDKSVRALKIEIETTAEEPQERLRKVIHISLRQIPLAEFDLVSYEIRRMNRQLDDYEGYNVNRPNKD